MTTLLNYLHIEFICSTCHFSIVPGAEFFNRKTKFFPLTLGQNLLTNLSSVSNSVFSTDLLVYKSDALVGFRFRVVFATFDGVPDESENDVTRICLHV